MSAQAEQDMQWHRFGWYAAAAVTALLLVYYCTHPALYAVSEREVFILKNSKTYVVMVVSFLLLVLALTPVRIGARANRIVSWCWFAAAPFAVYFSLLYMNAEKFKIHFFELNHIALGLTFLFLFLLETFFLVVTGSIRVSVVCMAVLIAVLGIANSFVISFRGMALSAADLFSLSAAASVASEYTYSLDWYMYMELLCTLAICMVSLKLSGGRMLNPAARVAVLVLWGAVSGGYYHLCCKTDFLENHDIRSGGFTHQLRYKEYDMIFTTLTTCFYLAVDKPEGYSTEQVKELADPYVTAAAEAEDVQLPNIVVIMNESFADYSDIGRGLDISEDCMPFIHSLTENTIKGYAYASIFGANTPNSEYEFLTGNTMAFLPESSVGFNLFVRGNLPSLASELKDEGYNTLAIHPYRGNNYRRHIVYPQIGFDTYLTRDDFEHPDYIRNYISDETLAKRILSELRDNEKTGKPLLSYNVTIQNHGGYFTSSLLNLDMEIEVQNEEVDQTKASIYVNLIRETDRMFEGLVEELKQTDEPTVVVMFGDHQPNLGEDTYEYLIGKEEDLTDEERMEKYKIPFLIWANYDIEEEVIERTSLNYLYSIMADRLELPMTGYQRYLLDLSSQIPVLCAQGYWGADGAFYEVSDQTSPYYEAVNEYNILEYNDIFGGKQRYLEFFG